MAAGEESIPAWAGRRVSATDVSAIQAAIMQFESKIAAEILPMMTQSSTSFSFARGYWFFIFTTLSLAIARWQHGSWIVLCISIVASFLFAWFFARIPQLSIHLVPHRDQDFETHEAAEIEFYRFHVNQTKDHGGILIYLSWLERRVIILADPALSEKVDSAIWKRAIVRMQTSLREKNVGAAFISAIEFLQSQLQSTHPRPDKSAHDLKNELSNRLVIR